MIWIEGRSARDRNGRAGAWESLWKYRDEYEHPLWAKSRHEALAAGHGGSDYFILNEFVSAIREQRPPLIDVYDAVTWSSIIPLSVESVANHNSSVAVPDFCR